MNYRPERWVTLELRYKNKVLHKILAGWKNNWRLSSNITQILDKGDYYEMHNKSGSIYECHKGYQGIDKLTDVLTADDFTKIADSVDLYFISLDKKCRWES